jgi:hypothetical protein
MATHSFETLNAASILIRESGDELNRACQGMEQLGEPATDPELVDHFRLVSAAALQSLPVSIPTPVHPLLDILTATPVVPFDYHAFRGPNRHQLLIEVAIEARSRIESFERDLAKIPPESRRDAVVQFAREFANHYGALHVPVEQLDTEVEQAFAHIS